MKNEKTLSNRCNYKFIYQKSLSSLEIILTNKGNFFKSYCLANEMKINKNLSNIFSENSSDNNSQIKD